MAGGGVVRAVLAAVVAVVLGSGPPALAADPKPPPLGTDFDYQLGGDAPVPPHVGIVARDRKARPAPGRYNICYVNGFQTQVDERAFWRRHWRLVLKDGGVPVVDESWGEWLLDIRTAEKRRRIARIVGRWTRGCAADGFDAVEYDNLDSFTRSHQLIDRADAVAYAAIVVRRAHRVGLAVGQKNLVGLDGTRIGFDFAVAEECGRWHECGGYVRHYRRRVLVIEYRRVDFAHTCDRWGPQLSVVLRDLPLTPDGVHEWC